MTIKELKEEIKLINIWLKYNVSTDVAWRINVTKNEKIFQKGYRRQHIVTNSRKAEIDNYLDCLIEACYEVLGDRFTYYI